MFGLANVRIIGHNLLVSEVHRTKKLVRMGECSNYWVFELTDVDLTVLVKSLQIVFFYDNFVADYLSMVPYPALVSSLQILRNTKKIIELVTVFEKSWES